MPLPKRRTHEPRDRFLKRCMADTVMRREFPDEKQRYAACISRANQALKQVKRRRDDDG